MKRSDSAQSFDSSVQLNSIADTQSTRSLPEVQKPRRAYFQEQDLCITINQTPRKALQMTPHDGSPGMFIGFKNGRAGNNVVINQSKIKRAKKFFEEDENLPDQQLFSMPFLPRKKNEAQYTDTLNQIPEDLSVPCFTTVGSGQQVQVSKQIQSKAKQFMNEIKSFKKPTKVKKESKLADQSLIKTVNQNKYQNSKVRFQKPESRHIPQLLSKGSSSIGQMARKSFNWEMYQREFKQEIEREQGGRSKSKRKSNRKGGITSRKKSRPPGNIIQGKEYHLLKLYSLVLDKNSQIKSSKLLKNTLQQEQTQQYFHIKQGCKMFRCVLCSINYSNPSFDSYQLYSILNKQFSKRQLSFQQFKPLYNQVCFKLTRYSCFWPDIVNKECHPSNIIVEVSRKLLKVAMEGTCSYLLHCIGKDLIGRKVVVVVREKIVNRKMNIVYLLLSDGWSSVWAATESHNILYPYLLDNQKVMVGTKLCLCLWVLHPLSNILQFCPKALPTEPCIQFFYNGSIILNPNSKLGYSKQQFYRPLNRCRQRGGLLPLVEGFVLRMFTVKQKEKKNGIFSHHYAQILTPEGFTQCVQFVLGEENSLVQYFRLFRYYAFYRLKISQNGHLSYGMDSSKYDQIKKCKISEKDKIFPQPVLQVLRKRLANSNTTGLHQNQLYDVICDKGEVRCAETKNSRKLEIEGEKADQTGRVLYQQMVLVSVSEEELVLRRSKYSSQSKRVPSIYQLI